MTIAPSWHDGGHDTAQHLVSGPTWFARADDVLGRFVIVRSEMLAPLVRACVNFQIEP